MKKIFLYFLLILPSFIAAEELTIQFEQKPEIYINTHDDIVLTIKPNGEATWIGDIPPPPIKSGEYDWESFHKNAKSHMYQMTFDPDTYTSIYNLSLKIISQAKPKNEFLGGKGYTNYTISFWGNPKVEVEFNSIGGKDFPAEIYELDNLIKSLPKPPNKPQHNRRQGGSDGLPPARVH